VVVIDKFPDDGCTKRCKCENHQRNAISDGLKRLEAGGWGIVLGDGGSGRGVHKIPKSNNTVLVDEEEGTDGAGSARGAVGATKRPPVKIDDGDLIIVSDVDEILRSDVVFRLKHCRVPIPTYFHLSFFYYSFHYQNRYSPLHSHSTTLKQSPPITTPIASPQVDLR
jgi:hypothetical protein